jgi:hypothetical protein
MSGLGMMYRCGSVRRKATRWLAALAVAGVAVAGCSGEAPPSGISLSYTPDPSYQALLDEPGGEDTLGACVDVLILQGWGADGFQKQTPAEVTDVMDRMLEAGSRAAVANMDKYGDFYLDLGRPLAYMQTGDYDSFMDSLASLRAQCEAFGFEYP